MFHECVQKARFTTWPIEKNEEWCPLNKSRHMPLFLWDTVGSIPNSNFRSRLPTAETDRATEWEWDQLLECVHYPATPIKMLCQCVAIVSLWFTLPLHMAAIFMTQPVWGSEDNSAMEPPQSKRLMLPFHWARSAAECARMMGNWKWRWSRGLGPIKIQARVSSPTLILLDLSHLSTLCKYMNTPPRLSKDTEQLHVVWCRKTRRCCWCSAHRKLKILWTMYMWDIIWLVLTQHSFLGSLVRWCLHVVLVFGR